MESQILYLNNAATSWPKPEPVRAAINEALDAPAFGSGRTAGTEGTDYIALAREKVAGLLHADGNICFTHNATDALNILISGFLASHRGCHVLTTELDHNSVLRPLHEHQMQNTCTYTAVPFDPATCTVSPETLAEAVTPATRLAVITHASNVLGSVQDIRKIAAALHESGIFVIVDGSQSAGHIPIDLQTLGADAFVFTGHKGLFGIPGTGGFWIADPAQIEPTRFGGTGTFSQDLMHPRSMPERFETGTQNYVGLAALAAGISFLESRGIDQIHAQGHAQSARICAALDALPGVSLLNRSPGIPIIAFTAADVSADDIGFVLSRKYHIVSRSGLHCAPLVHRRLGIPGSVRLSLSAMTTDDECNQVCAALETMFRG